MNRPRLVLAGAVLTPLPSGALWWEAAGLLCVSDLHLGRSLRAARVGGALLPPYETMDTLGRLDADLALTRPRTVVCLGDSFDDDRAAGEAGEEVALWLARMQAGRRWIWIEGNHDPGGAAPGGTHRAELREGPLVFRHIAELGGRGRDLGPLPPQGRGDGPGGAGHAGLFPARRESRDPAGLRDLYRGPALDRSGLPRASGSGGARDPYRPGSAGDAGAGVRRRRLRKSRATASAS
jgi:uncharacterized protein